MKAEGCIYRIKSETVYAIQYTGENAEKVFAFVEGTEEIYQSHDSRGNYLAFQPVKDVPFLIIAIDEYLVMDNDGIFSVLKPEQFKSKYEAIESATITALTEFSRNNHQ